MIQINNSFSTFANREFTRIQPSQQRQDSMEEFGQIVEKKRQEFDIRKTGDYKPKIQTGANSYSEDGWNRMMENFDSVQESVRAAVDQRIEDFKMESA